MSQTWPSISAAPPCPKPPCRLRWTWSPTRKAAIAANCGASAPCGQRGPASSILFLLAAGERSRWHRIDAAAVWLRQGGAPLALRIAGIGSGWQALRLGPDLGSGDVPQAIVPAQAWQDAESLGAWTLVSCIVAPAFEFAGFEMAAPGWSPPA